MVALVYPTATSQTPGTNSGLSSGLLSFIGKLESNNNPNVVFGGGERSLTNMTINQVRELQRSIQESGGESTAVGKYQIKDDTLDWLVEQLGLSGNEQFTEELQDKLAQRLLERRGWGDFQAGNIDEATFIERLSQEWAAIPKDESGKSYYKGVGSNKALASYEDTQTAVRGTKSQPAQVVRGIPIIDRSSARAERGIPIISPENFRGPSAVPGTGFPGSPPGNLLTRAARRGAKQSAGLYGQFISALGKERGFPSLVEVGDELVQEAFIEALRNPAPFESLDEVNSLSKAGAFVINAVGEQLTNIGIAAASAAISVASGGAATGGLAAVFARAGIAKAAAKQLAKRAIPSKKFMAGLGTFGGFLPLNTGEIIQEQRDAGLDPDLSSSLLLGVPSTALDVLGFGITFKTFFGSKTSKEAAMTATNLVLRRLGYGSLTALVAEGGTEAAQEAMVIASRKLKDPTFSVSDAIMSSEGLSRIAFAFASGAAVGGVFGGVGGVTRGSIEAARIKSDNVRRAIENELSAEEADEDGNVNSLLGFGAAQDKAMAKVSAFYDSVKTAVATRGNKELNPEEQEAANVAAHQAASETLTYLADEVKATDQSLSRLAALRAEARTMLRNAQQILWGAERVDKLNAEQNKAVRKSRDRIKKVLDSLKGLNNEEQLKKVPEALKLIERETARFTQDPLKVAAPRVRTLIRAVSKVLDNTFDEKVKAGESLRSTLDNLQQRVNKTVEKRLKPPRPENAGPIITNEDDIFASIDAVAETGKRYAFAVGSRLNKLAKRIQDRIDKLGLVAYQRGNRVVVSRADDMAEDVEVDFVENIADIDPDRAVIVRAIDKKGRVAHVEAVSRNNLYGITQVVAKAKDHAGPKGRVEIVQPHEEVTRLAKARDKETKDLDKNSFGRSMPIANAQERESLEKEDTEILVRIGGVTDDNRLYHAEINAEGHLVREDGKPFRVFSEVEVKNKNAKVEGEKIPLSDLVVSDRVRADITEDENDTRPYKDPRTAESLKGLTDVESIEVTTPSGAKGYVIRGRLQEGKSRAAERQVRHAIWRGSKHAKPGEYIEAVKSDGKTTVRFHAGEVTVLGLIERQFKEAGDQSVFADPRWLFINGLNYLLTQVELDQNGNPVLDKKGKVIPLYRFNFAPAGLRVDGKVKKPPRAADANLKIMGNTTYADAKPLALSKMRNSLYNDKGKIQSAEKRLREYEQGDSLKARKYKEKNGLPIFEDMFEWMLDRVLYGDEQGRKMDLGILMASLRKYGLIDDDEINQWERNALRERSDLEKTIMDGIALAWTSIYGTKIDQMALKALVTQPSGIIGQNFELFQSKPDTAVGQIDRSSGNLTPAQQEYGYADELEEGQPQDITDEGLNVPSEATHEIQLSIFGEKRAEEESRRINKDKPAQRDTSVPYNYTDSLRDLALGHAAYAPHKSNGRIFNFIWRQPKAEVVTQWLLEKLNIMEKVVLFDEDSLPLLMQIYNIERNAPDNTTERTKLYNSYYNDLVRIVEDQTIGRTVFHFKPNKNLLDSDKVIHVFVSKDQARGTRPHSFAQTLSHELGHIVERVYLDRLTPELEAQILDDFNGDREKFADWMGKAATDMQFGREEVRADTPLQKFLGQVLLTLKELWNVVNKEFPGYPERFDQFVAALHTYTARQRGEDIATPEGELAKEVLVELESLRNSGYLPAQTARQRRRGKGTKKPSSAASKAAVAREIKRTQKEIDSLEEWISVLTKTVKSPDKSYVKPSKKEIDSAKAELPKAKAQLAELRKELAALKKPQRTKPVPQKQASQELIHLKEELLDRKALLHDYERGQFSGQPESANTAEELKQEIRELQRQITKLSKKPQKQASQELIHLKEELLDRKALLHDYERGQFSGQPESANTAEELKQEIRELQRQITKLSKKPQKQAPKTGKTINIWHGKGQNSELSNLAHRPFTWKGREYQSVEHAYQTNKSGEFDEATYNKNWKGGNKKIPGNKRANHKISRSLMYDLITASMEQNPEAKEYLRATLGATLTHKGGRPDFWTKAFPEVLMEVRAHLFSPQENEQLFTDDMSMDQAKKLRAKVIAAGEKVDAIQKELNDIEGSVDVIEPGDATDKRWQAKRKEQIKAEKEYDKANDAYTEFVGGSPENFWAAWGPLTDNETATDDIPMDRPSRSKLLEWFNKGRQQRKELVAERKRNQEKHKARLIPQKDWWKNAPEGKLLDLNDKKIQDILKQHDFWELVGPPRDNFKSRSRDIAERLVHSMLITRSEFLAAALKARRILDNPRYESGEITFDEIKQQDLRWLLRDIIDKRVTKGDYNDLVTSIVETMPNWWDRAKDHYDKMFVETAYEKAVNDQISGSSRNKISAEERANNIWAQAAKKREKPTVDYIFGEAGGDTHEAGYEAYQAGDPMSAEQELEYFVHMAGYHAEKHGVEISTDDIIRYVSEDLDSITDDMPMDANVDEAVERTQDEVFRNYVDDAKKLGDAFVKNPFLAVKMLLYPSNSELTSMGSPLINWVAKKFHAIPGSTDDSRTVFTLTRQNEAPFMVALKKILDKDGPLAEAHIPFTELFLYSVSRGKFKPSGKTLERIKARKRLMNVLLKQTPDDQVPADLQNKVRIVRTYLTALHQWLTGERGKKFEIDFGKEFGGKVKVTGMGMKIGFKEFYAPLMIDSHQISQRREEFMKILQKHNFSEDDANGIRMTMQRDENGGLNNGFQTDQESGETLTTVNFFGPGFANVAHRSKNWTDALRNDLVDAGFYQADLTTMLVTYTDMAVRRATWQNEFGVRKITPEVTRKYERLNDRIGQKVVNPHSPVAKLEYAVWKAYADGQINEWQRQRILGDILPGYAGQLGFKVNSKIRNIQAWAVIFENILLLPFAIFSQFVDIGTIFARGDWQSHKAGLRVLLDKSTRDDARVMLEAIGGIRIGLFEHALNDQAISTFYTGTAKRINDMFFRVNQMEGWTNMMRAMALMSAREFIQRNGRLAAEGDKLALKKISELGLTVQDVKNWDGHSLSFDTDVKIKAAINRYIDEGMIRPSAATRPTWMNDPGYLIFTHLKTFLYGFHETFLRRVGREAKIHHNLLPLLTLMLVALPLAAIGYDLRRKITGRGNAPEGVDYAQELFERAGLFGVFQLVMDMQQADQYGKPAALALAGPTVEHLYTFLTTDDKDIVLAKSIPLVAQIPAAREWVKQQDLLGE